MCVKWEDGSDPGIRLRWGISANGKYERIAPSGGKDSDNFDFVIRRCVHGIDSGGERNTSEETSWRPIADHHGSDSDMPLLSETLHKVVMRAGKVDTDYESFLLKALAPFFDALENRFDNIFTNISLVSQVFERLIYRVFHDLLTSASLSTGLRI
jgi:hypothetical protein